MKALILCLSKDRGTTIEKKMTERKWQTVFFSRTIINIRRKKSALSNIVSWFGWQWVETSQQRALTRPTHLQIEKLQNIVDRRYFSLLLDFHIGPSQTWVGQLSRTWIWELVGRATGLLAFACCQAQDKETTLERADINLQLIMSVAAEKEREMFTSLSPVFVSCFSFQF